VSVELFHHTFTSTATVLMSDRLVNNQANQSEHPRLNWIDSSFKISRLNW
jgi:hypothetical protein